MGLRLWGGWDQSCPVFCFRSYGLAIGRGEDLSNRPLAEGVATAPIAAELCKKHAIPAPIITAVAALLAGKITIDEAVTALLNRPLKTED